MPTESYTKAQLTHHFNASPERVFAAWVNPNMMRKWLFMSAGSDVEAKIVQNEARVGGKWLIKDFRDGQEYEGDGEYLEIDPPRRLVFTFRMLQFSPTIDRVIVEIEPEEKGCLVTLTQEITVPHDESMAPEHIQMMLTEYEQGTKQGWSEMFDLLEASLA